MPDGWREGLVRFAPTAANGATGLCLERHDLVLSKLVAGHMKDYEFVTALLDAGLVKIDVLHDRAELLPVGPLRIRRIVEWLHAYTLSRHGQ